MIRYTVALYCFHLRTTFSIKAINIQVISCASCKQVSSRGKVNQWRNYVYRIAGPIKVTHRFLCSLACRFWQLCRGEAFPQEWHTSSPRQRRRPHTAPTRRCHRHGSEARTQLGVRLERLMHTAALSDMLTALLNIKRL